MTASRNPYFVRSVNLALTHVLVRSVYHDVALSNAYSKQTGIVCIIFLRRTGLISTISSERSRLELEKKAQPLAYLKDGEYRLVEGVEVVAWYRGGVVKAELSAEQLHSKQSKDDDEQEQQQ